MQEGQQVVVTGTVDVYERDGKYQLYARKIEQDGQGDLFLRFQKLRDQLEEMGMFAPEYKQPIPRYARTVGVVTASTGAAIRDIMNITARRNPCLLYTSLLAVQLKGTKSEYGIYLVMAAGCFMFFYGAARLESIVEGMRRLQDYVKIRPVFLNTLVDVYKRQRGF